MRLSPLMVPALACLGTSAPLPAQAPAEDPLYHVEVILFSWLSADRGEENFFHGREDLPPAPAPRLFEFPALELEPLPAFGAGLPGFGAGNPPPPFAAPGAGPVAPPSANPASGAGAQANPEPGANPEAAAVPPPTDGLELIELEADRAAAALRALADAAPLPGGFRVLQPDELTLAAEAAQMARLAPYRVLAHVGWAQTGVDTDRSVGVDLRYLGITNPVGTIEFFLQRFRHFTVDLTYLDGSASFWSVPGDAGLAPLSYAGSYRLEAERRDVRELTYVDHPIFGMLILIRPAPVPPAPSGNDNAEGPAA